MMSRHKVPCLATIGFLLLGMIGCGGGVPATGESLKEGPDTAARGKAMADGYMAKAGMRKGEDRAKTPAPPK
jgi:hypothetical protein